MTLYYEVMFKDELVAKVDIVNDTLVNVETYTNVSFKQPFLKKPVSLDYAKSFLEKRSIPRERVNINEVLAEMSLSEYDTLKILRVTHGVSLTDSLWIRFKGENLSWNDVKVRD